MSGATGYTIRHARAGDGEALLVLGRQLAASQGGMPELLTFDWIERHMLSADALATVLVAEGAGRIQGYVAFSPALETPYGSAGAYVSDLVVEEGERGRGLGHALLAAATAAAREAGLQHVWLVTNVVGGGADRFYRRIADIRQEAVGFAITGERFEAVAAEGAALIAGNREEETT